MSGDYTADMPWTPPEGMVEWILGKDLNSARFPYRVAYIYHPLEDRRVKMVKVSCTRCGDVWHEPYVPGPACGRYASAPFGFSCNGDEIIDGRPMLCPNCGAEGKAVHIGRISAGGSFVDESWVMTAHKVRGHLALVGWHVGRFIYKDEKRVGVIRECCHPWEGYVFEGRKAVRLNAYRRCMTSCAILDHWEQRKKYSDEWGLARRFFGPIRDVCLGTDAENCRLDLMMRSAGDKYPVSYVRLWQKHPQVENLLVQDMGGLLNDLIGKARYADGYYGKEHIRIDEIPGIDWRERRPSRMLGMNAEEFRVAVKDKWRLLEYEMYHGTREAGQPLTPEDISFIKTVPGYDTWKCGYKIALDNDIPVLKGYRYLKKQMEKYPDDTGDIDFMTLRDYCRLVRERGEEITDKNRWPQRLKAAHDAEVSAKKHRVSKALEAGFAKQLAELTPLAWECDGIRIRPVKNEAELIKEGELLHHCVATYAKDHASGESSIFLIRRSETPDTPWYTLELNTKTLTVVQNRGKRNCERTEEIRQFEEMWLAHIRELSTEKTRRKTA